MNNQFLAATFALSVLALPCVAARAADDADIEAGIASFRIGAFAEAYHSWSAASSVGDGRGARFIGVMWDTGIGVPQNEANALLAYRHAADLGDPVGMFNVGVSYDSGTRIPRDEVAAANWYARAASLHHGRSEYNLALMYEAGEGVHRDAARADRLFRNAARDGISAARSHLSSPHAAVGRASVEHADALFMQAQQALLSRRPQAVVTAAQLFRQLAAGRGARAEMAQYDLGWCYENGIGVPVDRQHAYTLYLRVAAETDDASLRDLAGSGARALHGQTMLAGAQTAASADRIP